MDGHRTIKVWDIATRAFHWALVLGVFVCWLSAEYRWMVVHQVSGVSVLGLLLFRLIWGFVGASTARFASFVKSPQAAARYAFASMVKLKDIAHAGHNPAGGLMVLGFLAILLAQTFTGLIANNDLGFAGPLADLVSKGISDDASRLHGLLFDLLLVMIWLHLLAVGFYVLVKGHNLLLAMWNGRKTRAEAGEPGALHFASRRTLAMAAGAALVAVIWLYPFFG